MNIKEIETTIFKILKEGNILQNVENIKISDGLIEELGVDSLGINSLLIGVEKYFNLNVPTEEFNLEIFRSVETIANYINSKINK